MILTIWDVIDSSNKANPFGIPAMVGVPVSIAQAVALFILAAYASDLIEALIKLQDGYHLEFSQDHHAATFPKWLCSCVAQLLAGLLLIFTSFVLTMNVETVVDVMLNLTARLFISEIDDIGFAMAKMGFLTDSLQDQVEGVLDIRVPKKKRQNIYRRVLYLLVLVALFILALESLKMSSFEASISPSAFMSNLETTTITSWPIIVASMKPVMQPLQLTESTETKFQIWNLPTAHLRRCGHSLIVVIHAVAIMQSLQKPLCLISVQFPALNGRLWIR